MTKILSIENVHLTYQEHVIFTNLHLTLYAQQWVALIGQSGIGKTSLLRMIAGLLSEEEKETAQIKLKFHDPVTINPGIRDLRVSYMPQQDLLLPWLTVLQNTLLITQLRYFSRQEKLLQKKQAMTLLYEVGLESAAKLFPHQLSGGMRQRVALVRTLMEDKSIILMDEPFSALDAITRFKLQDLAYQLLKNKTVLFITHDPLEALRLADDIYVLAGKPAKLHHVAHLTSKRPRSMSDIAFTDLHASLFDELTSERT